MVNKGLGRFSDPGRFFDELCESKVVHQSFKMICMTIRGGKQVTVSPIIIDFLFSLSSNLTNDSTS